MASLFSKVDDLFIVPVFVDYLNFDSIVLSNNSTKYLIFTYRGVIRSNFDLQFVVRVKW